MSPRRRRPIEQLAWDDVLWTQLDDLIVRTVALYTFHGESPALWPEQPVRRWLSIAKVADLRQIVAERWKLYPHLHHREDHEP